MYCNVKYKKTSIFFSMEGNTAYAEAKSLSFWKDLWGKASCLLKVSWFTGVQECESLDLDA